MEEAEVQLNGAVGLKGKDDDCYEGTPGRNNRRNGPNRDDNNRRENRGNRDNRGNRGNGNGGGDGSDPDDDDEYESTDDGNQDNRGNGAGNGDDDADRFFQLFRSLRVKVPMPIFKGEKGEDPNIFKTKAKDYMEAQEIPRRDRVREFRHCLEGKARMWYDEIERQIHPRNSWTDLIQKFCGRFCIYGKESEDWYRHWSALHFFCF